MEPFRFADPNAAHWLWGVGMLTVFLVWREWRAGRVLEAFMSRRMQTRLVRGASRARRIAGHVCMAIGLAALIVTWMRPQWGAERQQVHPTGAQLMVCLDVSRSMLAEDATPNRLERAKADIAELLDLLPGDQVGLIAFAGRASVLCPMTNDFGFLKLALEHAEPGSVGRGGTRLEEAIRKAIRGFDPSIGSSRVILLITDGEDLGSDPLAAADLAKKAGVRIITVGFGDEAGAKIQVTNRRTGAREYIVDDHGEPVVSRLNGAILREIALRTDAAYIPAGTGTLDLRSIYPTYMQPLARTPYDSETLEVRQEAFQWPLLAALLFLLLGLAIPSHPLGLDSVASWTPAALRSVSSKATLGLALALALPPIAPASASGQITTRAAPEEIQSVQPADPTEPPRQTYNEAVSTLPEDAEKAGQLLEAARSQAGVDEELRYRSLFNLGWLAAGQAEAAIAKQPKQACERLRTAIGYYRDAVRLRPQDEDARFNLEVLCRKRAQLEAQLRSKGQESIERELEQLIQSQRKFVGDAAALVDRMERASDLDRDSERARQEFRDMAARQRQLAAESNHIGQRVAQEREELPQMPFSETQLADSAEARAVRAAQLAAAVPYLQSAEQQLGQARHQLQLRAAARGHLRSARGLDALKRARDQFRPLRERIQSLAGDAEIVAGQVRQRMDASPPAWLTPTFLDESLQTIAQRGRQMKELVNAAVAAWESQSAAATQRTGQPPAAIVAMKAAIPRLQQAATHLQAAEEQARDERWQAAHDQLRRGIDHLSQALELFRDIPDLIEAMDSEESSLKSWLDPIAVEPDGQAEPPHPGSIADRVREVQDINAPRASRLRQLIQEALARTPKEGVAAPESTGRPTNSPQTAPQASSNGPGAPDRKRLEAARPLADRLELQIEHLRADAANSPSDKNMSLLLKSGWQDVQKTLEELRRLFRSAEESLQQAASQQQQLNDKTTDTEQGPGKTDEQRQAEMDQIAREQNAIRQRTSQLVNALKQMAAKESHHDQEPTRDREPQAGRKPGEAEEPSNGAAEDERPRSGETSGTAQEQASDILQQAARHVEQAQQSMKQAGDSLQEPSADVPAARARQDQAQFDLNQALQFLKQLDPSRERQPDSQDRDQSSAQKQPHEGPQQRQSSLQKSPVTSQPQQPAGADPGQEVQNGSDQSLTRLLQLIRERDAERHRDRAVRGRRRESVERDW